MKNEWVALITDQHFGVRNNSQIFLDYFFKFYEETFFPTLKEYGIEEIIDLGDTFDKRKTVDFNMFDQVCNRYFDKLQAMDITIYSIVGNHTAYYKNTNRVNTLNLLLDKYDNIVIVENPETIRVNEDQDILLMPWINEENQEQAFELLKQKHKYCFGHLEINGFEMFAGQVHRDGEYNIDLFSNVEHVYSGHFHHRSKKGNVMYLGNPYQLTWGDYSDKRGFHLINLETGELKFIENPNQMFYRLIYADTIECGKQFTKENVKKYKDRFVKVLVKEKNSIAKFQRHMNNLFAASPADVIVLENELNFDTLEEDTEFDVNEEDTITLCKQSVAKYTQENKLNNGKEIEKMLVNLFQRVEREAA